MKPDHKIRKPGTKPGRKPGRNQEEARKKPGN
jgi:hypothetical protein